MLTHWFEPADDVFLGLVLQNTQVEQLWSGGRWLEGPVYVPASRHLLFSDIPNDRVMRWDECSGAVHEFDRGCGNQNGHTVDPHGRVLACEHGGRRVSRREHDGSITTVADRWDGKRLNSPNDVVVKSDGSVWFTDPTYGIDSDYEGNRAPSEIGGSHVYRVDPTTGAVDAVIRDMKKPNGLAFSADEKTLYVVDSGRTHDPDGPANICRYAVDNGQVVQDLASSQPAQTAFSTAFGSTSAAICGSARATVCIAWRPTVGCSAR
jgi:gluconolactonase